MYLRTVNYLDLRTAAALSLLQLVAVLAALGVGARARRGRETALALRPVAATARRPRGRTWFGVGGALGIVVVLLGLPPLVLVLRSFSITGWTLDAYRGLVVTRNGASGYDALLTSLRTATDAATLSMVLGVLAAVALARARGRPGALADGALMLPLGVSAVTVGFGFLITLGELPGDLRTSPLLVPIAQSLVATPLVVRTLLPAVRAVDERLRQAAAVLGASPARVWREVDLPLVARALAGALGFAYVVSLGEFGATSFLARPDRPTLPVLVGQAHLPARGGEHRHRPGLRHPAGAGHCRRRRRGGDRPRR